jgi:hypothetical protein
MLLQKTTNKTINKLTLADSVIAQTIVTVSEVNNTEKTNAICTMFVAKLSSVFFRIISRRA